MLQLQPNETFPIVRVLEDHTDVSTNYVQAVIRDASTDALLATVNLTDLGNRRFSKNWKVPYDNVFANGRYILITTTVYTDSGYTTKNPNYGEVGETYLVQQRWSQGIYTSAGGPDAIDYARLEKILDGKFGALKLPKIPTQKDYTANFTGMVAGLKDLAERIGAIKIPEPVKPEPIDFTPIHQKLDAVHAEIKSRPKFEKTSLEPLVPEMQRLHDRIVAQMHTKYADMIAGESQKSLDALVRAIAAESIKQMQNIVAPITAENQKLKSILSTGVADTTDPKKAGRLKSLAAKYKL